MIHRLFIIASMCLMLTGCRFSPFSPELKQDLQNQNGRIEELKNNQNGFMLDLMKLRQQNEITARDIENFQQGFANWKQQNQNSGVQILQGDGALILVFALGTIGMLLIYHYRTKAIKNEKIAGIMAQEIANYNDTNLDDNVFMAAANTDVMPHVYHMMVKSQKQAGR